MIVIPERTMAQHPGRSGGSILEGRDLIYSPPPEHRHQAEGSRSPKSRILLQKEHPPPEEETEVKAFRRSPDFSAASSHCVPVQDTPSALMALPWSPRPPSSVACRFHRHGIEKPRRGNPYRHGKPSPPDSGCGTFRVRRTVVS